MEKNYLTEKSIRNFIDQALKEDVGSGDHSSLGAIPPNVIQKAQLLIKDEGIIAGLSLAEMIFKRVSDEIDIWSAIKDGDRVENGDTAMVVEGKARDILTAERLILNCVQRMSGIATYTHRLSTLIKGTNAKLLDTRKTTPNFRLAEKWAISIGGGINHRFGLYDMIILKDNHIDYAGGVKKAISRTLEYLTANQLKLKIEIEVRNLNELTEVMEIGQVHRIMLDNMLPSDIKLAIQQIGGQYETEASGGISEKNIKEIAETGVDFISVGALTHSYRSLDMSLKAI